MPAPKIAEFSIAYPGGSHNVGNLLDGNLSTEYSSDGKGTNTFVEFDFGEPTSLLAFRHVERNDPATVAASELVFLDGQGKNVLTLDITHVNQRSGVTVRTFPAPITAQRVRWHVTKLGTGLGTVGGAEIAFFTVGQTESTLRAITLAARPIQLLERHRAQFVQPLKVTVDYPYAEESKAVLKVEGAAPRDLTLKFGSQTFDVKIQALHEKTNVHLSLIAGEPESKIYLAMMVQPVRKMEIFILPHSHNDIGYTALQADVVAKQNSNIETGLRLAQETANYPKDARFVWNTEVLWCVDNYLREATPEKRARFITAVKSGQIGLDAFYCNILTGLCRPEELLNLMSYSTRLANQCGVPIESAMISDVPGYTWSTVTAMAQAGVKYFSFAPNYFDRMGGTMKEWQNRPFWWLGPDGKTRVLCWCPSRGYALGHLIGEGEALARFIPDYLRELETNAYPYDITCLRWNVHGDNGSPDEKLADVVRDWNTQYAYPRLIISRTATAFREFERRYGTQLPTFSGDYTPYWEDGAASSAFETAMNRASAERLVQAENLWAMRSLAPYPAAAFQEAWRNVLLYSEHTWGAHNSISQPDLPFVRDQWRVKQAFAFDADKASRALLSQAAEATSGADGRIGHIDVYNTSSWERTDLVAVVPELSGAGDRVVDSSGRVVPSQRLTTGELVFLAAHVPPLAAKRFVIEGGSGTTAGGASANGLNLTSSGFSLRIDPQTGAVKSLFSHSLKKELVDPQAATALNDYFYLAGSDVRKLQRNAAPRISVKEKGPLVASLLIESDAPGCKRLVREVRVIDGLDRVEFINTVDKLPIRAKEGLHFGYGFNVPDGKLRMDVGWAEVRPELDQIPAACKNWFSVQRWLDISNERYGITWSPIDAPLVEIGGITANLVGSQTDWRAWIQKLNPSQTIYSWVMNNHWHTNYRAEQEGATVFRYRICAHKAFASDAAARFGVDCSQPLLVTRAASTAPAPPRLLLSSEHVLIAGFKPTDDGKAWLVRLFGASGKAQKVKLSWSKPVPRTVWLSDTSEQPKARLEDTVEVPGWAIVTLRAE